MDSNGDDWMWTLGGWQRVPMAVTGVGGWSGVSGIPVQPAPSIDPFVFASNVAAMQPADRRWRRFQNALFLIEDVIGMHSEGSGSIALQLHHKGCATGFDHVFTLPFDCDDPVQWFAEHVMGMEFPNAKRAT